MSRGLLGYKKEINQMINLVFLGARVVFYLKSVIIFLSYKYLEEFR